MINFDYNNSIFENDAIHLPMKIDHEVTLNVTQCSRNNYNNIQDEKSQNRAYASDINKYIKEGFNSLDYNKQLMFKFEEYEHFINKLLNITTSFFEQIKDDPFVFNFFQSLIPKENNLINRIEMKKIEFKRCNFINEHVIINELYNNVNKLLTSYEVFFKGLIVKLNEVSFFQMDSYCLSINKNLIVDINIKNLKSKAYYQESIYKKFIDSFIKNKIDSDLKDLISFYERLDDIKLINNNNFELHPSMLNKTIKEAYNILFQFNNIFTKKFSSYILNVNKLLFLKDGSYKSVYLTMKEIPFIFNKILREKISEVIDKSGIVDLLNFDEVIKVLEYKTFIELKSMSKEQIRETIFTLNNLNYSTLNKINNFSYGLVYKRYKDLSKEEKQLYKKIKNEITCNENNESQYRIIKNDPKMTKSKYRMDAIIFDNDDIENTSLIKKLDVLRNVSKEESYIEETKTKRIQSSCNTFFIDVIYKKISIFFNNPNDIMVIK